MARPLGKLPADWAVFVCALLAGLPAVVLALALLWTRTHNEALQCAFSLLIIVCWLSFAGLSPQRRRKPTATPG